VHKKNQQHFFCIAGCSSFYFMAPYWLLVRPATLPPLHTQQRLAVDFGLTPATAKKEQLVSAGQILIDFWYIEIRTQSGRISRHK